jgi:hypothetical protein
MILLDRSAAASKADGETTAALAVGENAKRPPATIPAASILFTIG